MSGARSPTLLELENLNRYVDKIAVFTALHGAEQARLVFGTDIDFITEQIKQIEEKLKKE